MSVEREGSLSVTMRLLKPPESLSLFLPQAWAGERDWASQLRIQRAAAPSGELVATLRRDLGRVDLEPGEGAEWVELSYEVELSERLDYTDRFSPHSLEDQGDFFAYAPTFLILPSERLCASLINIPVEIITSSQAELVTTWRAVHDAPSRQDEAQRVRGFIVPDFYALYDAFVMVSSRAEVTERSPRLKVAFEQDFRGEREDFARFIDETLARYEALLGPAGDHTTALIRAPRGYHVASQRWGTGRRGGFVLEVEPEASLDQSAEVLIAHEALHLWNGHALVADSEQAEQTKWFKEGVTHYLALRTLYHHGVLEEREFLAQIARAAARYEAAHREHQSAEARAQIALYPYDHGLLLAMEADAMLHARGEDLSTWLKDLLERLEREPSWRYDADDLWEPLAERLDASSLDFISWRRHCEDREPIALDDFFARQGLHWLKTDSGRESRLIPLKDLEHAPWMMTSPPL